LPPEETVLASVSGINSVWAYLMSGVRSPFALDAASAPVAPQASLGRQLMEPPPRPPLDDQKIGFALQLASGLCFLHSHGILHHDIKTDNALLDAHYTVCKLSDFGLASLSLNYACRTSANTAAVGGTLRYLAPERAEESHRHARKSRNRDDGRGGSSVSLGLGRTLVSFEDRADVYACNGLRPQFSEAFHRDLMIPALTVECWAQRPEDRPSMSTVLERLEACMQAFFAPPHNLSNLQSIDSSMDLHKSPREVRACKPSLRPLTEQGASFPVQRGKYPWDWEQQNRTVAQVSEPCNYGTQP
jgi:serine/threonine protein kinase